jgi:hypothetical protein
MFHRYRARRPVLAEVDFEPLVRAAATLRAEWEETAPRGETPSFEIFLAITAKHGCVA